MPRVEGIRLPPDQRLVNAPCRSEIAARVGLPTEALVGPGAREEEFEREGVLGAAEVEAALGPREGLGRGPLLRAHAGEPEVRDREDRLAVGEGERGRWQHREELHEGALGPNHIAAIERRIGRRVRPGRTRQPLGGASSLAPFVLLFRLSLNGIILRMQTELVPYGAIHRITISSVRRGEAQIGFNVDHQPVLAASMLGPPGAGAPGS